jgi:hypothetical protein
MINRIVLQVNTAALEVNTADLESITIRHGSTEHVSSDSIQGSRQNFYTRLPNDKYKLCPLKCCGRTLLTVESYQFHQEEHPTAQQTPTQEIIDLGSTDTETMVGDDTATSGSSFAESDTTVLEPSQRLYAPRFPGLADVVEAKMHPPDNVNVLVCVDEAWRTHYDLRGTNVLAVIQHEKEEVQVLRVVSLCALEKRPQTTRQVIYDYASSTKA